MTEMTELDKTVDQMLKNMQKPAPEALYHQLGRLRNEMPPWQDLRKASTTQWRGRVQAVVEATQEVHEIVALRNYFDYAVRQGSSEVTGKLVAQQIDTVIAKLELKLPAGMQGAFIPAGGVHDGYQAASKAAGIAKKSVFFVDPYADDTLVSEFVALVPENVPAFIMSDEKDAKPSLKPGAERWVKQHGATRPLSVRLAPPKSLHDRLLVIDSSVAFAVGQSFKDFAKRAHSSLVRVDPDTAARKIEAHITMWNAAKVVV